MAPRTREPASQRVRLKPQDSFDLIRLLARSQSDARKAIGELVQNSLDAAAQRVEMTWMNERGERVLVIHDDGEGIFPGLPREEALRRLAQTIGHSHKRHFSPAERHQQLVLGKYGIGLLGFWCVAATMEIKSRVAGGDTWILRLREERPEAEVLRARGGRVHDEPTFTEIVLRGVKESVQRQVRPPRLQAYLAAELRGQLLQRRVRVQLHDRVARGRAQKLFVVEPRPYLGRPIEDLVRLEVPGHEEARLELYHVPPDEGRHGVVSLSCGGTTVLDDIAAVDATDPDAGRGTLWSSGRFEGVIDFPELQVAPGTRRGFVPDEPSLDFVIALQGLERELARREEVHEQARARERREQVAREIRRAFVPVARRLPEYELFDVRGTAGNGAGGSGGPGGGGCAHRPAGEAAGAGSGQGSGGASASAPPGSSLAPGADAAADTSLGERAKIPPEDLEEPPEPPALFPPGPLAEVLVLPARVKLAPGSTRVLKVRCLDAAGQRVSEGLEVEWTLEGPGSLEPRGLASVYSAPTREADARVLVRARQGEVTAEGSARVLVRERQPDGDGAVGIPEPEPVDAPSEPWRSRIRNGRWEYNQGHRDYVAAAGDETRRLRYLVQLFAKEVVLRNFGAPQDEALLERMVEVLTHAADARPSPAAKLR